MSATIEQRVASLEQAVAELQQCVRPGAGDWLKRVIGSVSDPVAFEEVLELGRAFRQADRPD